MQINLPAQKHSHLLSVATKSTCNCLLTFSHFQWQGLSTQHLYSNDCALFKRPKMQSRALFISFIYLFPGNQCWKSITWWIKPEWDQLIQKWSGYNQTPSVVHEMINIVGFFLPSFFRPRASATSSHFQRLHLQVNWKRGGFKRSDKSEARGKSEKMNLKMSRRRKTEKKKRDSEDGPEVVCLIPLTPQRITSAIYSLTSSTANCSRCRLCYSSSGTNLCRWAVAMETVT